MKGLSDREHFLAVVGNQPVRKADAIIVLAGEDGVPRAEVALQLYRGQVAPVIVLTGGLDDDAHQGAKTLRPILEAEGVPPEAILDDDARNTPEQATNVLRLATAHGWTHLILIASPGHLYRAFLTFVKTLWVAGQANTIRLTPIGATQVLWWSSPSGVPQTRLELLETEFQKIDQYRRQMATYDEALTYLAYWEHW